MQNPFTNRNFLKIYFIAWGILAIIQLLFLIFLSKQDPLSAALQTITSILSYAILGFGVWFVIKYKTTSTNKLWIFTTLFLAGLLVIILWIGFGFVMEKLLFKISSGTIAFERKILLSFAIGALMYVILVLTFHLMIVVAKYTEKSNSEERLQNLLTETKLNALKAYINPHFLFNSLNSVNTLITTDPKKAREMLINLSDYFRFSLKQKDNTFVNFEEELNNALTYLEIEKLRFNDKINLNINIDERLNNVKVPVMILQPMFENVVKHAVSESLETIFINLETKFKDTYLEITLSNNYDSEYISKNGTGIGLSTNFERFNLLYHRDDLIEVSKNNNIFKVILKIPINLNEDL